jgi:hypothetical protein
MINRLVIKNVDEISEQLKISDIKAVSLDIIEEASSKYLNSNVDYDLNSKQFNFKKDKALSHDP